MVLVRTRLTFCLTPALLRCCRQRLSRPAGIGLVKCLTQIRLWWRPSQAASLPER